MVIEMGGATYMYGMHFYINVGICSEDITMNIDTDKVNQLLDEIDILEKDVKKYKDLYKQNKIFINFMVDYALAQRRLHRYNHDHCVKQVVDKIPNEELLNVSKAFEERLKERCKDKEPGTFELIMESLNIDSYIKG